MEALWHPSPNFSKRDADIRFIVLHGTWMADDTEVIERLCDPAAEVSAHYLIDFNGKLHQFVKEEDVAWHAGKSCWQGYEGLNKYSIGIEVSNLGEEVGAPYTAAQYNALISLLKELAQRYNLPAENVIAHSDIAPDRKNDPGAHFDWSVLEAAGVAAKPKLSQSPTIAELKKFGYHGEEADILAAYQRRVST